MKKEDIMHEKKVNSVDEHHVKSVRIQSFSGPYFPAFELNMRKQGPEKLQIRILFTQWKR